MSTIPNQPSPTNYVTDVVTKQGKDYLSVASNGTATGTTINLSDGHQLGIVQSVEWSIETGGISKCKVTVLASPGNLQTSLKDTTILVRPAEGYSPIRYLIDWYGARFHAVLDRLFSLS